MPIAPVCDADVFTVDLLGVPVNCTSLDDAVAVKTANDILTNRDPTPYRMDVVLPFVRTLGRYGRHDEAKRLSAMFR
jgi:hypothetical protein